jgi:uncharacterized protein YoxC
MDMLTIVNLVLGGLAFFGILVYVIPKLNEVKEIASDTSKLLDTLTQALTDGKIDAEELKALQAEGTDIVEHLKKLLKKKK